MADHQGGAPVGGGGGVLRDYRKGNWTPQETTALIEAKKIDDERRAGKDRQGKPPSTEFRWKWVEDYCWRRGCYRSKNQCNDRWDNLMRDYKKVRAHERRAAEGGGDDRSRSYWELEKHERKQRGLPSSFLPDVYEALVGIMERREGVVGRGAGGSADQLVSWEEGRRISQPPSDDQQLQQEEAGGGQLHLHDQAQALQAGPSRSESDHHSGGSPSKKKKKRREGSAPAATAGDDNDDEEEELEDDDHMSDAIRRSVSVLAEALAESDGREDARHTAVLRLRDRQMGAERARVEATARAVAGLSEAITGLATSIRSLSPRTGTGPPK